MFRLRAFFVVMAASIALTLACGSFGPAPTPTPIARSLEIVLPTVTPVPPTATSLPATPTEPAADVVLLPTDTPQPAEPTPKSLGDDDDPLPVIQDAAPDEPVRSAGDIPVSSDQAGEQAGSCDPSYPDVCIPPLSVAGDLDCTDIPQLARFQVLPPDPHGFDRDGDGIGCETN